LKKASRTGELVKAPILGVSVDLIGHSITIWLVGGIHAIFGRANMKSLTAYVATTALVLIASCCCPFFSWGKSSDPKKDFEALVWSPMPSGVTPISADYENIGLGDGYRAVHFRVDTAELMGEIIEKHQLTETLCTYTEQQYPLEEWQTRPKPDEIKCFEHIEHHEKSETIDYWIVLYTDHRHTEGLFKVTYF
jgi:hypothetical protein